MGKYAFLIIALLFSLGASVYASGGRIVYQTGSISVIHALDLAQPQSFSGKNDRFIATQDFRLTCMTILSTLFAVFFVYSGFKIDKTVEKVSNAENRIRKLEQEAHEDMEFSNQLKYAIQYMLSKQYKKAIDALVVLRAEPITLKHSDKLNSCNYFLAICHFEQGRLDKDIAYIAKAVEFINEAIDDPSHPLKNEIIQEFNNMDTTTQ